jgi:nicotinamidase-related amidase
MQADDDLNQRPLTESCAHICVDMQRLFAEDTAWFTPWMERVLPNVERIAQQHAERTIFTRFIPAEKPGQGSGTWKTYYERWHAMTIQELGRDMVELVPALAGFVPPGTLHDKHVYSPWIEGDLHGDLQARGIDTLVVTGGETDVCVLATVLGAVDRGYRVVVVSDALCSSSDESHDASLGLYHKRYGVQVETATTQCVLDYWHVAAPSLRRSA